MITLYAQGWEQSSISRFLHVSRPTVDAWIKRFATEHFAGLLAKSSAPKAPARKGWRPLMLAVSHLQKRHPDAGKFRIWSLLAHPEKVMRKGGKKGSLAVHPQAAHQRLPSDGRAWRGFRGTAVSAGER